MSLSYFGILSCVSWSPLYTPLVFSTFRLQTRIWLSLSSLTPYPLFGLFLHFLPLPLWSSQFTSILYKFLFNVFSFELADVMLWNISKSVCEYTWSKRVSDMCECQYGWVWNVYVCGCKCLWCVLRYLDVRPAMVYIFKSK